MVKVGELLDLLGFGGGSIIICQHTDEAMIILNKESIDLSKVWYSSHAEDLPEDVYNLEVFGLEFKDDYTLNVYV